MICGSCKIALNTVAISVVSRSLRPRTEFALVIIMFLFLPVVSTSLALGGLLHLTKRFLQNCVCARMQTRDYFVFFPDLVAIRKCVAPSCPHQRLAQQDTTFPEVTAKTRVIEVVCSNGLMNCFCTDMGSFSRFQHQKGHGERGTLP